MDTLHLIFWIALAFGLAGKMMDCITTYIAIYVRKDAVEGDKAAFAQWMSAAPWHLFVIYPLIFAAIGGGTWYGGASWLYVAMAGLCVFLGIIGVQAGVHNLKDGL